VSNAGTRAKGNAKAKAKGKPNGRPKPGLGKGVTYNGAKRVQAGRSARGFWIIAVVVVAIGIAGVVALASGSKPSVNDAPASAAVVKAVTTVPKAVFDKVGVGTATAAPKSASAPALTQNGKPRIVYIGAEYCPYCATERWAMVAALSRFGTFSGLKATHSSSIDVFPSTPTLSFHGSTYTSPYLVFTPVETNTNVIQGDGYVTLEKPTAEEEQLLTTYDVAPYTTTDGAIPFLYFAGKYISVGATYDPTVLQGTSAADIAAALSDPTSAISKGAIGAANGLTAAICSVTGNRPAAVCADPMIRTLQGSLQ
jgi:Domain of unknown function (DUF929)